MKKVLCIAFILAGIFTLYSCVKDDTPPKETEKSTISATESATKKVEVKLPNPPDESLPQSIKTLWRELYLKGWLEIKVEDGQIDPLKRWGVGFSPEETQYTGEKIYTVIGTNNEANIVCTMVFEKANSDGELVMLYYVRSGGRITGREVFDVGLEVERRYEKISSAYDRFLLNSFYANWTVFKLSADVEEKIKETYVAGRDNIITADVKIERYYSTYDGAAAVMITDNQSGITTTEVTDTIDGVDITYSDSRKISLWKDGKLYSLKEAYESGILHKYALMEIAEIQNSWGYTGKVDEKWIEENKVTLDEIPKFEKGDMVVYTAKEALLKIPFVTTFLPTYRSMYYWAPTFLMDLVPDEECNKWIRDVNTSREILNVEPEEMYAVSFIKHFKISREDFDKALAERAKKFAEHAAKGEDISGEEFELLNGDILYTFDNEIINNYYRR